MMDGAHVAVDGSMRGSLPPGLKVAIVHEWLESYAGSERVLEQLIGLFPEAKLFALVDFLPASERGFLGGRPVEVSFLQRLPFARRHFRTFLGLMPIAVEQFDLSGFDLVLTSSHAVAKGVLTGPDQLHVSYVHSPMRYAWDLQPQYLRMSNLDRSLKGLYARWLLHRLRVWDVRTAPGVDAFIANSNFIARRIRKVYGRHATVIYPPVETHRFTPAARGVGAARDTYLVVSRLVPYKRVELAVEAFRALPHLRLQVVGDGSELKRVRRAAKGLENVSLRPPVSQAELVVLMQDARAVLFTAEEDFGITTVEAQACGTPVIAYGRGGARDIVVESGAATGVLFDEQSAESLAAAIRRFELDRDCFTEQNCRDNALRFSVSVFREGVLRVVEGALRAMAAT